jgi:hypothetical protein
MMADSSEGDAPDWFMEYRQLSNRIAGENGGAQLGSPDQLLDNVGNAWVLIFNGGQEDEGVYTLQGRSASNIYVLAFERRDEASRFAQLLQAEEFDMPEPTEWGSGQLQQFCDSAGFELGLVPTGTLLTPPSHNSYDMDAYERLAELRQGPADAAKLAIQRAELEKLFDL